jgi:predicted DNA-binding transcriptional regulator YafY
MDGIGQDTWVFPGDEALAAARHLPVLRRSIRLSERVIIDYIDGAGIPTERPVRPLILEFWGRVWTLATWCEAKGGFRGFRSFRVDRIAALRRTGETFPEAPGTTLTDWRQLHGS